MADAASSGLTRAASRKWLGYSVALGLLVIAGVLIYRGLSGNTMKSQRIAREAEKALAELASKPPGNSESFSATLAARARKVKEDDALAALTLAATPAASASPASAAVAGGAALPPHPEGEVNLSPAILKGFNTGSSGQGANLSDEQIDAYAALKAQQASNVDKKMGVWEPEGAKAGNASVDPNNALLSQLAAAGVNTGLGTGLGGNSVAVNPNAALLETYLKTTQGKTAEESGSKFLTSAATKGIAAPLLVQPGPGAFAILEGTAIPIAMRTAVSSDIGGPCRAQVVKDIYDSATQRIKLIPAGTSLMCIYNPEVLQGQERIDLAFTRMVFAGSNASVALSAMQAGDAQGMVGAKAEVNTRFWRTFGSSFLVAGLAKLAENSGPSVGVTVNVTGQLSSASAQVLSEIAKQSLQKNMQIKPELTLKPGDRLNMIVTRDMVLDPALTGVL